MDRPITVAVLTRKLQNTLHDLGPLTVVGELTQLRVVASGHCYATLKDHEAVLSLVMWRNAVARHGPLPAEGTRVEARGSLDIYPPRGAYQLIATRITAVGAGDLAARFEALKHALAEEGLFDEDRKIDLPFLPRAVGLATAPGSAALADMLDSIRQRFPAMPIVIAPCRVQGAGAAAEVAAAITRLDAHPEVDVIVAGRGGGSLEDLWAFNEEVVVRTIAACATPIISAVGHETDTTLADLAADLRAKTPTAAGEVVVPVQAELEERLRDQRAGLDAAMDDLLATARERLGHLARHRALAGPGHQVALRRQQLDELGERLGRALTTRHLANETRLGTLAMRLRLLGPAGRIAATCQRLDAAAAHLERANQGRLRDGGERLRALAGRLDALSPLAVIGRGYSVVETADGRVVRHREDAPLGCRIRARVIDGYLDATVDGGEERRLREAGEGYEV